MYVVQQNKDFVFEWGGCTCWFFANYLRFHATSFLVTMPLKLHAKNIKIQKIFNLTLLKGKTN
jgi:hypothetical protein